jgi:hypothetical protein
MYQYSNQVILIPTLWCCNTTKKQLHMALGPCSLELEKEVRKKTSQLPGILYIYFNQLLVQVILLDDKNTLLLRTLLAINTPGTRHETLI